MDLLHSGHCHSNRHPNQADRRRWTVLQCPIAPPGRSRRCTRERLRLPTPEYRLDPKVVTARVTVGVGIRASFLRRTSPFKLSPTPKRSTVYLRSNLSFAMRRILRCAARLASAAASAGSSSRCLRSWASMMALLGGVVDAVRCAVEIQCRMSERNADVPDARRIEFRIGVNLGDVIVAYLRRRRQRRCSRSDVRPE